MHKFGGTCVAAAERIREAAQLVISEPAQCKLVVVSAMGSHPTSPVKVTDLLLNMVAKASRQDQAFLIDLAALQARRSAVAAAGCNLQRSIAWGVACAPPAGLRDAQQCAASGAASRRGRAESVCGPAWSDFASACPGMQRPACR